MTVPENQFADARFSANRVSGFSGCNQFDARYRAGGRTLFISESASTLMACSEEANAFESAYLAALHASRFYSAKRNTLTVFDADRTTILEFDAAPRNPMLGNWTVNSFQTAPGTLAAPIEGTQLSAVFGIASVGGSGGCNQYTGTYGTNGNIVRIGRLATTRLACADEIMTQETAFLTAMEGAALIQLRGDAINLTDLSGTIVVALVRHRPNRRVAWTDGIRLRRRPSRRRPRPHRRPPSPPRPRPRARHPPRRRARHPRRPCRHGRPRRRRSNRPRRYRRPPRATWSAPTPHWHRSSIPPTGPP